MAELMVNSLALKEFPREFKTLDINIQYAQLNQILGPFWNVCYHLHRGKLHFLGDEKTVTTVLKGHGFISSDASSIKLNLHENWEIILPIFYKCLRFYFYRHNFVWKLRGRNQVFIIYPEEFDGTRLVHELYNKSGERLLVYEGFRYWFEFLENDPVLTLLPKVKPILPFKQKLTIEDIIYNPNTYQEVGPVLMRQKYFSREFRGIALKQPGANWKKRNVLKTIVKLLSDDKEEIIVPAGNMKRGLILDSEFIKTEEVEADFYGK